MTPYYDEGVGVSKPVESSPPPDFNPNEMNMQSALDSDDPGLDVEQSWNELEHERDLLRDVALRLWNEVEYPEQHRDLAVSLGFVLSMTGDRELSAASLVETGRDE